MDFISGLSRMQSSYDSNMGDCWLSHKVNSLFAIQEDFSMESLAKLYVDDIVRLHGALVSIVFDRDPWFTSRFWLSLQNGMGTKLKFSIVFHPRQMVGQSGQFIF